METSRAVAAAKPPSPSQNGKADHQSSVLFCVRQGMVRERGLRNKEVLKWGDKIEAAMLKQREQGRWTVLSGIYGQHSRVHTR